MVTEKTNTPRARMMFGIVVLVVVFGFLPALVFLFLSLNWEFPAKIVLATWMLTVGGGIKWGWSRLTDRWTSDFTKTVRDRRRAVAWSARQAGVPERQIRTAIAQYDRKIREIKKKRRSLIREARKTGVAKDQLEAALAAFDANALEQARV